LIVKALNLWFLLVFMSVSLAVTTSIAFEMRPYQMREDYGLPGLTDHTLQYYYYIPTPTYSWFWAVTMEPGDILGAEFQIGDTPTGGHGVGYDAMSVDYIRILDFAGYGTVYPGQFTVEFDIYRSDGAGCPIGESRWNSGPIETRFAWNYIEIDPPFVPCESSDRVVFPFLVTATHVGSSGEYPMWGFDNISSALMAGASMHDSGCLPALYPRPGISHYSTVHTGYYGNGGLEFCPPHLIPDGRDAPAGQQYGCLEIAWTVYTYSSWYG